MNMNPMMIFVILVSAAIGVGRFTVPGHQLTGWMGGYETFAHIWVGALIVLAVLRKDIRWEATLALVIITILEVLMFVVQVKGGPQSGLLISEVFAQAPSVAPAATQNTVTTTGPVTSDTTISIGTLAGQAGLWIVDVFGVPIGGLITAILWKLLQKIGVSLTDDMRARFQEIVLNGMHLGAAEAERQLAGKAQVTIKNAAVANTIAYAREHGADELKQMGVDPQHNSVVDFVSARISAMAADPTIATPKVFDPPAPTPAPAPKAA